MDNIDRETGEIVTPFLRTPYNYDRDAASVACALDCSGLPSRTQEHFKEEVDINTIVRRFGLTGELPSDVQVPVSGDFTDVTDYQSALNLILAAQAAFDAMPADVRTEFSNDPARFVDFVSDERNRDRAKALGLLVPEPKAPEPTLVRVVADPNVPAVPPAGPVST